MNYNDTPEIRCSLRNLSRVTECPEGLKPTLIDYFYTVPDPDEKWNAPWERERERERERDYKTKKSGGGRVAPIQFKDLGVLLSG